jgi:hypothetical protein
MLASSERLDPGPALAGGARPLEPVDHEPFDAVTCHLRELPDAAREVTA